MKTFVILDLKTGLIDNWVPGRKARGYSYRQWLVDEIKEHHVILVSSKPKEQAAEVIRHIWEQTGWVPNDFYFSPDPKLNRHVKRMFVLDIFKKYGGPNAKQEFVAIEHDDHWRKIYASFGINNLWIDGEEILTDIEIDDEAQ